jgi:peptide/nickel transport system substrate-binding protein
MIASFEKQNIQAMIGLNNVPSYLKTDSSVYINNIPLTAETMVFYQNASVLLSNSQMREALTRAVNINQVISALGYPVIVERSPLLQFQTGYNAAANQVTDQPIEAASLFNSLGWTLSSNGYRYKGGQQLQFSLYTQDNSEYQAVARSLISQWKKAGVNVSLVLLSTDDLKSVIANKSYDMLLYSISIGIDPDVFAYWDSSQAQLNSIPGLNLSQYKSATADTSLAQGRTVFDPALRAIKYLTFLQDWEQDNPSLALYQPNYVYITRPKISGLNLVRINNGVNVYSNVANWEIKQVEVTNK